MIEHEGVVLTISEWARRVGVPVHTLWQRLERGWPLERALRLPARRYAQTGRYSGLGVKRQDSSVGEPVAIIPAPGDEGREPQGRVLRRVVDEPWLNLGPIDWVRALCLELGPLALDVRLPGDLGLIAKQLAPGCWVLADLDERLRDRMIVDLGRGLNRELWGRYVRTTDGLFEQSALGTFAEAVAWLKYLDLGEDLLAKE